MPFLLNNSPIQRAVLTMERLAVWEAIVTVAGVLDLADGAAVQLLLGDVTFNGHVVPGAGGTFEGGAESTYTLAGGTAGWSKVVPARGYNVASGVLLASVAAQLAADAGELLDLGGLTTVLGDHWERPTCPASVALSALFPLAAGGWRIDPDGFARPGPRPPAPLPASVRLVVEDYRASERWARLSLPDDAISAVLPGAILTAGNLTTPLVVSTTTIRASLESVTVEVRGEGGLVELLVAIVQALTPSQTFNGLWTYQVADIDTGRPNLRALANVAGLPPVLACDKVPGVPGWTSTLQAGALVLLGFRDGSPARPFVAHYLGGVLPAAVALAVAPGGTIAAGGTGALVLDAPLQAWVTALTTACASHGITVPALTGEATTVLQGA